MVAISLYRGKIHRVREEGPRKWLMPSHPLSLSSFRRLTLRRNLSLSLLPSSPPPLHHHLHIHLHKDSPIISHLQVNGNLDDTDEKEKRKREIEEKLQVLNEKKHNLVQALKQILNAEEELKRRVNVQANRPPLPLQVDVSNDSGSMTRHATPRAGSDINFTIDTEVGDDAVNRNQQPRQLLRVNSTSPSAESALRKPPFFQHNAASYPSRAAMVAAGSPSCFAPTGNQGQSSSMPTVSVSGTNYIPSSPSPAASGGTSCFRDARHPSPWS